MMVMPLMELEHETRTVRHFQFMKPDTNMIDIDILSRPAASSLLVTCLELLPRANVALVAVVAPLIADPLHTIDSYQT
eukprot:COSAG05_NODE_337_length_11164_cov_11.970357_9_plen_78_part_00